MDSEALLLTRHRTETGPRWALNGQWLPASLRLGLLLERPAGALPALLSSLVTGAEARGELLPPLEPEHEVWAAGVTYLRSREARSAESEMRDVYERVYDAARPELFFKSTGARAVGHQMPIRVRRDARWNVPEAELTLVVNRELEIVGYTAGNDVSSRDVEGDNPLYLPQAKIYEGSCALGPAIRLASESEQDLEQMLEVAGALEGNLTASVYSHPSGHDDATYERLAPRLRPKVGRLLNDKMPTGVAVSPAMNHGGPFPATANAGLTAVGLPASIRRFTALHCYDGVRESRLPEELRDANPTGKLWRAIDGTWSTADVAR